ncbi:hypothetical protein D7V82_10320 [bacterium 1xD8-6]|nr:hypothetical protein D7V72_12915 [bacterium D16-36]RKI68957.1 hypothetical protein D7V82_10320 [bacterium 1xD8-6]
MLLRQCCKAHIHQSPARQSSSGKPLLSSGISCTSLLGVSYFVRAKTETQPDAGTLENDR